MAAISIPPHPNALLAMSSRRVPLSSNQNVANSPLRTNVLKQKRTLAQVQQDELYGQPSPAKKLVLDAATQRVIKSPSQQQQQQPRVSKSQIPVQSRRTTSHVADPKLARERAAARQQRDAAAAAATTYSEKAIEEMETWKNHHRVRFPKSLFYFDQVPSDVAHRLKKQIAALGGRETAFFSVDVTHVITSRPIPPEDSASRDNDPSTASGKVAAQPEMVQAETINPSLLTRVSTVPTKRRLLDADLRARANRIPPLPTDQPLKAPKKAADILVRARDMKKKIWTADKAYRLMALLVETDPYRSVEMAYGRPKTNYATQPEPRAAEDRNLLQLLQKERVNVPADRELTYFKGPYIYVYDIDEKQRPIMVREYNKVSDRSKGEWPQFQTAAVGRCPFIEDSEIREAREAKEAAEKAQQKARVQAEGQAVMETKPVLQPPKMAPPKPVTGKRTLREMELGHNRQSSVTSGDIPSRSRSIGGGNPDSSRKAFTSHAATGRLLDGEPVASGLQRTNVTSAIRSQMISSTATTPGLITGLSKEVHCLQRQVLKWPSTIPRDQSSRPTTETSFRDENSIKQQRTLSRTSSRKLELINEESVVHGGAESTGSTSQAAPRKKQRERERELKPGYCENCAEKYADFDEHIESENHRNFANNDENWVALDALLTRIVRKPKRQAWK
ncbi:Dfp1/Him1, central region-domain-containing protein [Nemania sp. NC0429]|nr:Dfp1/Him1, central region-domain-containing protein [Nemania sp. NC0429]